MLSYQLHGLGTYKLKDPNVISASLGRYDIINTAELYRNETLIVNAILKTHYRPFIITKISKFSILSNNIKKSFYERLNIFKDLIIDVLLLHHPSTNCLKDWEELSSLYIQNKNRIRYIGVSNYRKEHLEQILNKKPDITVYCNEIEINPFCFPKEDIEYCRKNNILIIAHTPLMRGTSEKLGHPILLFISAIYNTTVIKLLIQWSKQNKFIVIPKADTLEQLNDNIFNPFIISKEHMIVLNHMDEGFRLTKVI